MAIESSLTKEKKAIYPGFVIMFAGFLMGKSPLGRSGQQYC